MILSDTHGHAARCGAAVTLLKRLGAETFVHCGDVGGAAVLDKLAEFRCWSVWGNTDIEEPPLERYAETLGLHVPRRLPARVEMGTHSIAVFHGHEHAFFHLVSLLEQDNLAGADAILGGARTVCYGHTHRAAVTKVGGVRFVNPGALHRAAPFSVATLDLETDAVEHWIIDDRAEPTSRPRRYRLPEGR
ncbi:MAG: metallophosphoesterase family protein [Planctomycetes bacterium]|nr:metallophosphoesterase family protein [Planctomycetota bacterium]